MVMKHETRIDIKSLKLSGKKNMSIDWFLGYLMTLLELK